MSGMEALREGVWKSLPELADIGDSQLRALVVEAWALALSETEYERLEDIPAAGIPDAPAIKGATQAEHLRITAQLAIGMIDAVKKVFGSFEVNRDVVIAGALVHDVGKPYEFSPRNRVRWETSPNRAGMPAVRHPVYGVHIALMAKLPEPVVHIVGSHSRNHEGQFVAASLEATIVQFADQASWWILDGAGMMEWPMFIDRKVQLKKTRT